MDFFEQQRIITRQKRNITLNEFLDKKDQLRRDIKRLVMEFEESTGVTIENIVYDDISPNSNIKEATINLFI
jgi:hypothetical protein